MTRSMVRNVSAWLRSSFWDKVFVKTRPEIPKVKTPKSYYRSKAAQQITAQKSRAKKK
jgi:hypothetical protein